MRVDVGFRADLGFRLCKALFTNEINIAQPNRPSRFFYAQGMRMRPTDNEIAELKNEVADLKRCVKELKQDVSDLVSAWRAGSLVLSVVKWAAGLASAVAVVWSVIHGGKP